MFDPCSSYCVWGLRLVLVAPIVWGGIWSLKLSLCGGGGGVAFGPCSSHNV